jgi:exodeoxyribonuclease V
MIKKYLASLLHKNFDHIPTESQEILIEKLSEFISDDVPNTIFLLKGYAGTGKTSIIGSLVKTLEELKLKSVLLAPTGRAAKVLSGYSQKSAYTIHKKIYRQKATTDALGTFTLDKNFNTETLFIVDEASMIYNSSVETSIFGSGQLLQDLLEYVYSGFKCKLLFLGDTAQLPPVGLNISPALDMGVLKSYGYKVTEVVLTEVIRQSKDSGILSNATKIRNQIQENSNFKSQLKLPKISLRKFNDIKRINGQELIEKVTNCYDKYGIEQTIIICRSNVRANKYNAGIRSSILYRETQIEAGDMLMVVKNNYFWIQDNAAIDFIANGDIVKIIKIFKYEDIYDFRFVDVRLQFVDYNNLEIDAKIMLNTLTLETASLPSEDNQKLFF